MSLLFFIYDKIEITVGQLMNHFYMPHKGEMLQAKHLVSEPVGKNSFVIHTV